ncbi:MAG: mercuric reductase [Planctomycetia bacterium]|nr:mercuric reductase [Planctomycetia bacterium]
MTASLASAPFVPESPLIRPMDEHNRELLSNVHPPDWTNPDPARRYNLVVIGAGAGGLVTSLGAAGLGAKVALVEKYLLGGDCLNVGCVPSKSLLRCGRAYADVRDAGDFGVRVPAGVEVDFPAVMERMRRLRTRISPNDGVKRLRDAGVDVFLGEGRFVGPDAIEVAGKTLRFSRAVIAAGARASAPPVPGLNEAGYLTNETVFWLTELPRRLAVIGAGPIGCELSQAFARLGSEVHLLEAEHQILGREDRDASEIVQRSLLRDGIHVGCQCKIVRVHRDGAEKILQLERGSDHMELRVDEILVGVGRKPNVERLGLEQAQVSFDARSGIVVNDRLQTSNRKIYAVGDICSQYKFTHMADAMARIALQNALFFGRAKVSALTIPWCTYTDPEIAHVGMYEKDARDRGLEVDTIRLELSELDRALLDGEEEGFLKVHVKKGTDRILGATLVSRHAGEMISELTLAMVGGLGLKTLSRTIHSYPTQAEIMRRAGDAYNRTRLTPFVKGLFHRLMSWRR